MFAAAAGPDSIKKITAWAKAERVFLKLPDEFTEQGRRVNRGNGPNHAPRQFPAHPHHEGVTKRALNTAMEALLTHGGTKVR
ncbi:MAG: hypothetical protein AAGG56_19005 [Pseudomonadota bacterium]